MEGWIIMKIRQGFVSNSSSSSFIVSVKLNEGEMTKEELLSHNMKKYNSYYEDDSEWVTKKMKAQKNKIIYVGSAEYGSEESVEDAVTGVLEGLGIDSKKIVFKFEE
jgi:hypothetical protein